MTTETTTRPEISEAMTPHELQAACKALVARLGKGAHVSAVVADYQYSNGCCAHLNVFDGSPQIFRRHTWPVGGRAQRRLAEGQQGLRRDAAQAGHTVDLNATLLPTFVDDAQTLENVPLDLYDLVLADPPYSVEDAEHYQTTMVKRNKVMSALGGLSSGTFVVWLDQVLPMYRKDTFSIDAVVGLVKSTNHRFRVMTVFRRL